MNLALPNKWELCTFDDVCTPTEQVIPKEDTEFFYIDISSVDRISKKIISPQRIIGKDAPSRARKLIKTGDVIVSMTRPNLNAVALVGSEYDGQIASTGFEILRSNGVDPRWIGYLVRTNEFIDAMTSLVQGALYPAIRGKDVRAHQIPVAPLAEQRRIADKLDTTLARVDALNDRLARITPLLKRFRQSVLAAATSGRLTEDWRAISQAENEWRSVSLKEVAGDFSYGSSAKSAKTGKVPVLRMGNIQEGALDWTDLVYTSDPEEIKKYKLVKGDVLFNRTNSPELVGKTAIYQGEQEAIYAGYLIRVKCSEKLIPEYLNYCLGSPMGREYCWQVKSDGVSQSNINAKKLAAFEFLLPPIEEQTEIVRRVASLFAFADRLEARLQSAQTAAERLTPALLAKAFRGELVPQDASDEPATELLRRLRESRAADATSKPKRGRAARASTVSE